MSFLTLEDVNTTLYSNQGFWWHCIDLSSFDGGDAFTDVKVDFCSISRKTNPTSSGFWKYTVIVDNILFTNLYLLQYILLKLLTT